MLKNQTRCDPNKEKQAFCLSGINRTFAGELNYSFSANIGWKTKCKEYHLPGQFEV